MILPPCRFLLIPVRIPPRLDMEALKLGDINKVPRRLGDKPKFELLKIRSPVAEGPPGLTRSFQPHRVVSIKSTMEQVS